MSINEAVKAWVKQVAEYTKPETIRWCEGTESEARELEAEMVQTAADAERRSRCARIRKRA